MQRCILAIAIAFASLGAAPNPAASPTPPQVVRLTNSWFTQSGALATYRFGIYATGVDRSAIVVFDRDTPVPIENPASFDAGDDNVALPAGQRYLRVTLPEKFHDRVGKVAVQVSQDGRLSAVVYVHVESNLPVT